MSCGPSNQEKNLAGQSASFSNLLSANYATQFGAQPKVLGNLSAALNPITMAGPNQQGFSNSELNSLNTAAVNNAGGNYRNAAQALGGQLAGRGGGGGMSSGISSGVDKQIRGSLASSAAGNLSGQENNINLANYAQGRQNFWQSIGGQQSLANAYDPTGYANQATSANKNAFGEADQISTENNNKTAAIAGGIASLATDAGTFGAGAMGGGGFTGGMKALSGGGFG